MVTECSQVGDTRPLTQGKFTQDGSRFITGSWTGLIKMWDSDTGNHIRTYKGHTERCNSISIRHQLHGTQIRPGTVGLASSGSDSTILLWDIEDGEKPLHTLRVHDERVNRVVFHPHGGLLGSTSHDLTWRLTDVETQKQIQEQEGHAKAVYSLSFHPDGSLAVTSDLAGVCRLWDLRTGRSVMPLVGHHKQVLCTDFHPHGHLVSTASDDNSVKLWDLRRRKCVTSIMAHLKLVSEVKFEPDHGNFMLTASYDSTVKLWSTKTFECIKALVGHEARIMGADLTGLVGPKKQYRVGTSAYDRTLKLWSTSGEP